MEAKKSKRALANIEYLQQEAMEEIQQLKRPEPSSTAEKQETEMHPGMSRHALEIERALLLNRKNVPLAHLYADSKPNVCTLLTTLLEVEEKVEANSIQEGTTSDATQQRNTTVCLPPDVTPPTEEEIAAQRITIEDIKKLPKFGEYVPGVPNKVRNAITLTMEDSMHQKSAQKSERGGFVVAVPSLPETAAARKNTIQINARSSFCYLRR